MADQSLRFTLDFLAKTAGLKSSKELLDQIGDELDDSVDSGKQFARAMRLVADRVEADLDETRAAADALAAALGPEMAATIGQANLDNYAAQFRRAGLTVDDVRANVDELADSIRRLEGADPAVRQMGDSIEDVGRKTEKSGSVMANFAGNAVQELPGVGAAFGPLNTALGQFAEYATEGDISMGKFLKGAGALAGITVGFALLTAAINEAQRAQREMKARTDEVVPALEEQISKAYELAAATGELGDSLSGGAVGADALNRALLGTGESGEKLNEALGALGISSDYAVNSMRLFAVDPLAALKQLALGAGATEQVAADLAEAVGATDASLDALADGSTAAASAGKGLFRQLLGGEAAADDLAAALLESGRAAGMTDQQIANLAVALEAVQDEAEKTDLDAITQQFLNNQYASNEAARGLIDLAEANLGLSRADEPLRVYDEFNRLLGDSTAATRDAVLGTNELGETLDEMRAKQEAATRKLERHRDVLRQAEDAQRDYTTAVLDAGIGALDVADAEDRLTEALETASTTTDDTKTAVDEKAAAQREAERAALALADAELAHEKALAESTGATLTAADENRILRDRLRAVADTLAPGDPLRLRLEEYIDKLDNEIPEKVETEVTARYNVALGKLGYGHLTEQNEFGQFGSRVGSVVVNVNVTNPVMNGEQIAAELAAYMRRSGATFKLFGM